MGRRVILPSGRQRPPPFHAAAIPNAKKPPQQSPMPAAIALKGIAGHLALWRWAKSLEITGAAPIDNHTAPVRPPTRRISLAMAPAFPPKANEKRRPPAQSPSRPGPQPIQAKGTPRRVPPCAWIGRRQMDLWLPSRSNAFPGFHNSVCGNGKTDRNDPWRDGLRPYHISLAVIPPNHQVAYVRPLPEGG